MKKKISGKLVHVCSFVMQLAWYNLRNPSAITATGDLQTSAPTVLFISPALPIIKTYVSLHPSQSIIASFFARYN